MNEYVKISIDRYDELCKFERDLGQIQTLRGHTVVINGGYGFSHREIISDSDIVKEISEQSKSLIEEHQKLFKKYHNKTEELDRIKEMNFIQRIKWSFKMIKSYGK